jgi:predicted aldo/keto reductase-like oxidoreductase
MGARTKVPERRLGNTDLTVSRLGLGSSAFRDGQARDWVPLVEQAVDSGITYYDTARSYVNGEDVVGLLPDHARSRMVITTKTGARGGPQCIRDLQTSLRTLNRGHIDVWMTHMIETEREYELCTQLGGFCDIGIAARDAGAVRAVGASFHASTELVLRAIVERAFDVVMFPFNVVGRETVFGSSIASYRDQLLPAAHGNGVGVVVMKVLAGGEMRHGAPGLDFLADDQTGRDELGGAVRYAVAHPGIDVAVVGMADAHELEANVAAVEGAADDWQTALRWGAIAEEMAAGPCTRCGHCLGVCPEGIEIPKVFRLFDQARYFGMTGMARHKYALLEADASHCSRCRRCTDLCPETFDIAELLLDADRVLQAPMPG